MPAQISSFIFITFVATLAITYLKLAIEPIISKKEFKIWVISWFAITFFAFFTFNFLLFVVVSAVFIFFISKQTENKLALFCILLFAIPSYQEKISVLFTINFTREIALILLLPLFTSLLKYKNNTGLSKFGKLATDKLVILYLTIVFLLYFRGLYVKVDPTSFTEGIRYGFYLFCEIFLPYYFASRYIKDFRQLRTVLIAFVTISIIIASIAILEIGKSWLLYGELANYLKISYGMNSYILRSGLVRASASLDHALVLGLVMLIALGFFLYISESIASKKLKLLGFLILIGGLIAPLARGSWIGAAFMILVYFSLGYKKYRNISLVLILGFVSLPLLAIIPGGQKILNFLPFIGNVDKMNVDYRSQLIEQSLLVIKNYPMFGVFDPTLEPEMQVMVQGAGIIDLVNYYLEVTLRYGIVGLLVFVILFTTIVFSLYKHLNTFKNHLSIEYLCGKSIFAALLGTLLTISTLSGLNMINTVLFLIAGLAVSYIRVTKKIESDAIEVGNTVEEQRQYPTSRVVQTSHIPPKKKLKVKGYLK